MKASRLRAPWVLLIALVGACAAERPFTWVNDLPAQMIAASSDPIRVGDRLHVLVKGQDPLSGEFEIRADGGYAHPVIGRIHVAGLRPEEAARLIAERLRGIVVNPEATVAVVSMRPPIVSVIGEVRQAGRFEMTRDEGVMSALARAGGLTEFADTDTIFVVRSTPTPLRIRFRLRDLTGGAGKSLAFKLRDGDVVVVE